MIDDLIPLTEDTDSLRTLPKLGILPWKVLVVDDDVEVHEVTRFVLHDVRFFGRPLMLLHAYSGKQARGCLGEHPDIAAVLLDVVMETDQAGLDLVGYIRTELGLAECRIILRTGQPGYAPELAVIREYDINDYRTKAELTHTRLITMIGTALRTYQQLHAIAEHRRGLEQVVRMTAELMAHRTIAELATGLIAHLANLLNLPPDTIICAQRGLLLHDGKEPGQYVIVGAVGEYAQYIAQPLDMLPDSQIISAISDSTARGEHVFESDYAVLHLRLDPNQAIAIFIASGAVADAVERPLLDVLLANTAACFRNVGLVEHLVQAQRQIESQHAFLRTVIDADPHYIYVKDRQNQIRLANRSLAASFDLTPEQMVGRNFAELITDPECLASLLNEDADTLNLTQRPIERELKYLDRTGQPRWLFNVKAPISNESGNVEQLLGIGIDITERQLLEEQLRASLHEKEVLLKEIHHRVKNNLQVISSLLDLQAENISDPVAVDQFQQSRNRVRSMAFIHECLYQSPNLARIDFAEYVRGLVTYLLQFHDEAECEITTQVTVTTPDQTLSVEVAVPCGLIINELVINAMKHAFVGRHMGQISILLQAADEQLVLRVKDNGVGFPDTVDFRRTSSLGMTIVISLVAQLKGNIELYTQEGTEFVITFPDWDKEKPSV